MRLRPSYDQRVLVDRAFPGWSGKALRAAAMAVAGVLTFAIATPLTLLDLPSPLGQQPWSMLVVAVAVAVPFVVLTDLAWRLLVSRARLRLDSHSDAAVFRDSK